MTTRFGLAVTLLLALALLGLRPGPAHAATTITVTDCSAETSSTGTGIAQAVTGAGIDNTNDTITFGCTGTIPITSTLNMSASMTIDGTGKNVTLDGGNTTQLFYVPSGVTLGLTNLALSHGASSRGGAMTNYGTLIVTGSTLSGNSNSFGSGGAITNYGTLVVTGSTLSGNTISTAAGGAIENGGTATITRSTFSGNSAPGGTSSNAIGTGGAINEDGGTVTIVGSTFSGNSAGDLGGAVNLSSGTMTITTSTFSGNSAYRGGAIGNVAATLTITNSTIANNSAPYGGGGGLYFGDTYTTMEYTTIGGTIFHGDDGGDCGNLSGVDFSAGYNFADETCSLFTGTDQQSDPQLGTLADNGGPTQTMALAATSPAIDKIPAGASFTANGATFTLCPATGATTDQRGYPRPDAGETSCDIGTYESGAVLATTTSLTSSANPSIIGESVTYTAAVSPTPDGGTVDFQDGGSDISGCSAVAVSTSTGHATCQVTYSGAGSHSITGAYSGDNNFSGSPSSTLTQTVTTEQTGTTTTLGSSANPSVAGKQVMYTATVSPTPDGGTVDFQDGGSDISGCGAVAVNTTTGSATCSVSYGSAGRHSITAAYSGGIAFSGSASPTLTQTVVSTITITVTNCSNQTGTGGTDIGIADAVAQANTDNANDIITFACSGTIPVTTSLNITGSMTIDGSGQRVTLDGGNKTQLLYVNFGSTLGLTRMTLSHGANTAGGAIKNGGTVAIASSTFSGNVSSNSNSGNPPSPGGGAIANYGKMTITRSTFSGNSAAAVAGAIENLDTLTITTSTFANNSSGYRGGAIENAGTLTITTTTFGGDSAQYGGAIYNRTGTTTVGGNIFGSDSCYDTGFNGVQNVDIIDKGYNDDTLGTCTTGATGDSQSDPQLGALADNGGPTQTMALAATSPAIDKIPAGASFTANGATFTLCPATGATTDQRGYPRPDAGETSCDIGTYESGAVLATTTSLTSSANPSPAGKQVTYTATASPAPDGGTVNFQDAGTTISGCASQPVGPGGTATCQVIYSRSGSHTITAIYSGDSSYTGSTSGSLTETVLSDLTTTLTLTPNPVAPGGMIYMHAAVTNTNKVSRSVTLSYTITASNQTVYQSGATTVTVGPGMTLATSASFTTSKKTPAGTYTATVTATDATGSSSATASETVS